MSVRLALCQTSDQTAVEGNVMKITLALLVSASFALTGCATQPDTQMARVQAAETPSQTMKADYNDTLTAARQPRVASLQ